MGPGENLSFAEVEGVNKLSNYLLFAGCFGHFNFFLKLKTSF